MPADRLNVGIRARRGFHVGFACRANSCAGCRPDAYANRQGRQHAPTMSRRFRRAGDAASHGPVGIDDAYAERSAWVRQYVARLAHRFPRCILLVRRPSRADIRAQFFPGSRPPLTRTTPHSDFKRGYRYSAKHEYSSSQMHFGSLIGCLVSATSDAIRAHDFDTPTCKPGTGSTSAIESPLEH